MTTVIKTGQDSGWHCTAIVLTVKGKPQLPLCHTGKPSVLYSFQWQSTFDGNSDAIAPQKNASVSEWSLSSLNQSTPNSVCNCGASVSTEAVADDRTAAV